MEDKKGSKTVSLESNILPREKPPVKEYLNDFSSIPMINQQVLKLGTEADRLRSELKLKEFEILQNIQTVLASISSHLQEITSLMDKQSQQIETLDQRVKDMESEIKRINLEVTRLLPSVMAIEKNLGEIRNLTERVADKSDTLSEEFIERYVKEPTIEQIVNLYDYVRQASDNVKGNYSALLEQVRNLLEAQGARIIEPKMGSEFIPSQHRPVKKVSTPDKGLDKKVARVFRTGIGHNGRVIQHAVVELFVFEQNTDKN